MRKKKLKRANNEHHLHRQQEEKPTTSTIYQGYSGTCTGSPTYPINIRYNPLLHGIIL
jgi:hypothetical protein